jgi:hypothetical protein
MAVAVARQAEDDTGGETPQHGRGATTMGLATMQFYSDAIGKHTSYNVIVLARAMVIERVMRDRK